MYSCASWNHQKQPQEVFLKILKNTQENTCFSLFLVRLRPETLLKKDSGCFPVNFKNTLRKYLRTLSSQNISGRLLLSHWPMKLMVEVFSQMCYIFGFLINSSVTHSPSFVRILYRLFKIICTTRRNHLFK